MTFDVLCLDLSLKLQYYDMCFKAGVTIVRQTLDF